MLKVNKRCLRADPLIEEDLLMGLLFYQDDWAPETELYIYHPDHLGSSSWITDINGDAIQHLHYLPWGEQWIDQRNTGWNAPFTFSAKERDEETGYSYFGARYYWSEGGFFLTTDPLSSKYPNVSSYCYTLNNPIRLIDPDGREVVDPDRPFGKPNYEQSSPQTPQGTRQGLQQGTQEKSFFQKVTAFFTGGFGFTAKNGQGQETRKGDGNNETVDVSELTGSMPEAFEKDKRETSNTQNTQSSKPELIQDGYVIEYTNNETGAKSKVYPKTSEDSARLRKWWGSDWIQVDTIYPNMKEKENGKK